MVQIHPHWCSVSGIESSCAPEQRPLSSASVPAPTRPFQAGTRPSARLPCAGTSRPGSLANLIWMGEENEANLMAAGRNPRSRGACSHLSLTPHWDRGGKGAAGGASHCHQVKSPPPYLLTNPAHPPTHKHTWSTGPHQTLPKPAKSVLLTHICFSCSITEYSQ